MRDVMVVDPGPDSQAVYSVAEPGAGIEIVRWGDGGDPVHLVEAPGPGVLAVYFQNGPPPVLVQPPDPLASGVQGPEEEVRDDTPFMFLLLED